MSIGLFMALVGFVIAVTGILWLIIMKLRKENTISTT
jgi:hypothetical protein